MKVPYFVKRLLMSSVSAASAALVAVSALSASAESNNNTVIYNGETLNGPVYGGASDMDHASGNSVTLNQTTVNGTVCGGYTSAACSADEYQLSLDANGKHIWTLLTPGRPAGEASGNAVVLHNSSVTGNVYGGYSVDASSTVSSTVNNTVTLVGNSTVEGIIYGGNGADVTGNKLVLKDFNGSIGGIKNFEEIRIITSLSNTGSGEPDSDTTWTLPEDVKVSVELAQGGGDNAPLETGSKTTLLSGLSTRPDLGGIDTSSLAGRGRSAFFVYDFNLDIEERTVGDAAAYDVVLTLAEMGLTPQTKALAEARVATMQLNSRAGDLVAARGMGQAKQAAQGRKGMGAFFAMSAGHDKVDSGSHVNVNGISTMLGVSGSPSAQKKLTIGGFVESGWGNYTTHNNFAQGTVRGTGESSYVGAGLLMDYNLWLARTAKQGLSVDASLRAGRQETDFCTADMQGAGNSGIGYDSDGHYISGHVGVNYRFSPTEKLAAQAYARYMWSQLGGDKAEASGEQVDFESMSSNRLQLGMRAEYKLGEHWTPHAGLAYEWECSGNAHARIRDMGVAAPSMRGGSLSGEIGTTWQPNLNRPLWFNGGVQAGVGKREGYGANVGCTIAF